MEPIHPQPGSYGDPSNFVGRTRTTQIADERLLAGTNLALTDPRRMGKSSWIEYYCKTTKKFTPVYIDYQGVRTREEFLLRTVDKLRKQRDVLARTRTLLAALFEHVEEVGAGPLKVKVGVQSMSATALLERTIMAVNDHAIEQPVLVCMDEVPWAIRNITEEEGALAACELLQALRALRAAAHNVRWIVCGSIGFHHVLRNCGATVGEINDLYNLPLGPLDSLEALELAHRLLLGAGREPNSAATLALAQTCGRIPFLMHKLASLLQQDRTTTLVNADAVHAAYNAFIDDRDDSRAVTHLLERLEPNYGQDADLARTVLDTLATGGAALAFDDLVDAVGGDRERVSEVVTSLVDDHYLIERAGVDSTTVQWRYDVLRLIWLRRRRLRGRA